MSEQIQRITVKSIIEKNGEILLVCDQKGVWEMPGGKIDFGETPDETITRELNEELGIENLVITDLVNVWSFVVSKDGSEYQFIVIVYKVEVNSDDIKLSDEHKELKWIPITDISELNMRDGYKISINKYYKNNARRI